MNFLEPLMLWLTDYYETIGYIGWIILDVTGMFDFWLLIKSSKACSNAKSLWGLEKILGVYDYNLFCIFYLKDKLSILII